MTTPKGEDVANPPVIPPIVQTHGAAMVACLAGWFACAMFASVGCNWTFYDLLGLAVAGRDVTRARAGAYAHAAARAVRKAAAA